MMEQLFDRLATSIHLRQRHDREPPLGSGAPDLRPDTADRGQSRPPLPTDPLLLLRHAVDAVVAMPLDGDDPSTLRAVARQLTEASGRIEGVRARVVATATASGTVQRDGATSGAAWLAAATGGSTAAASRTVALGDALAELPALATAVHDGSVGPEHATALARAAGRGVLDTAQLDAMVDEARALPAGAFSRALRSAEGRADQRRLRRDERWARERRSARWWTTDDGSVEGTFRLPAVAGATFRTAVERLVDLDPADVPDDRRRTPTQRQADALERLAGLALDHGLVGSGATGRPHVTVTVPVTMMLRADDGAPDDLAGQGAGSDDRAGATEGWRDRPAEEAGAVGVLPDGTVISAQTARRLLCDATVRRLVVDPAGRPLDVGRATRTWSPSQRTAVEALDGGCRGPSCDRPVEWTEIHHVRWWRHGGGTAVDNGLALCGACHDLVHHDGWTLRLDPGTRTATWTSPSGAVVTTVPSGAAARRR